MTKFDPTKPVQTRDGRPARILATDSHILRPMSLEPLPIVAEVQYNVGAGLWDIGAYRIDGMYCSDHGPNDLVNIPTKREGWVILQSALEGRWVGAGFTVFKNKREAEKEMESLKVIGDFPIACVKVEWGE